MICATQQCPGEYERLAIARALRRDGRIVAIDGIPADLCRCCGDIRFDEGVAVKIERLLQIQGAPLDSALVYRYEA